MVRPSGQIIAMNTSALIPECPVMFTPSLAKLIGVNAAIILNRIEWLAKGSKSGREIDGERWIWNTYEAWQEDHFPLRF